MNTRYTLLDVTEFCYKHKKRRSFVGKTYAGVASNVIVYDANGQLAIAADDQGIVGVVLFKLGRALHEIHIHEIVCIRDGLKLLVEEASKRYPEWDFIGTRNKRKVKFNHTKLWAVTHQTNKSQLVKC